ncbi:hypothetical protein [Lentisalinibacter salinarum]|uniref:hypothetical protein n=1 Tax=Lentisalinibacter salinarum TaxID=2992239 RepID=UPI00386F786C
MKDQYFGDINDYRKYGLLRCLTEASGLPLGVYWMRTADDGRSDGGFRKYLDQPDRWRHFDPDLYDQLCRLLRPGVSRSLQHVEDWGLIPGAGYYHRLLTDSADERNDHFDVGLRLFEGFPVIFFDPDNGMEVQSVPYGRRNSGKYLYWREIEEAFHCGHSLVIYQHFPREKREAFIERTALGLLSRTGAAGVDSFRTANVVFFLVAQPAHRPAFHTAHDMIVSRWGEQIVPATHVDSNE